MRNEERHIRLILEYKAPKDIAKQVLGNPDYDIGGSVVFEQPSTRSEFDRSEIPAERALSFGPTAGP